MRGSAAPMRYMDNGEWDWALKQFDVNRSELSSRPRRHVGFGNRRNNGDEIPF